ncbi:MAG: hypothetical protein COB35_08625 [Gammaproteobacteria bacterium]|nr:MAG: hypothetical protein COB35_08625 [Gammaproteobacteria bacterium]
MKIKILAASLLLATTVGTVTSINAQELEVTVTNLTQGMYYTPLLISAHPTNMSLYTLGQPATAQLQMMAEGGDISGLSTMLTDASANSSANPAGGLLAPAMSTTAMISTTSGNDSLSIVAMLLPTNDGFVGLNGWKIPSTAGTYTFTLNAYDAGTEVNDEIINGGGAPGTPGIPAAPGGEGGTGGSGVTTTESNKTVHVHRGNLGDDNLTGGKSDVNNSVHRWLNPVARVIVKVM